MSAPIASISRTCDICNGSFASLHSLAGHVRSKKHRLLALPQRPQEAVLRLQYFIDTYVDSREVLLGLQYIQESLGPGGDSYTYTCLLCHVTSDWILMLCHVIHFIHKCEYLHLHHRKEKTMGPQTKEGVHNLANAVYEKDGREKIKCWVPAPSDGPGVTEGVTVLVGKGNNDPDVSGNEVPPVKTNEVPPLTTAKDPAVTAKDPSVTAKDPPVTAKDPPVTAKDPPVTAKDPAVTAKDPSVTAKDPPVTAKDPPVTAKDPPVTAKDPAVTAKDPPVTAKYPAAMSVPVASFIPTCDICNGSFLSIHALALHVMGKIHRQRALPRRPQESVLRLQYFIDTYVDSKEVPVGLQYLRETPGPGGYSYTYTCRLCDVTGDWIFMVCHVFNFSHKYEYLSLHQKMERSWAVLKTKEGVHHLANAEREKDGREKNKCWVPVPSASPGVTEGVTVLVGKRKNDPRVSRIVVPPGKTNEVPPLATAKYPAVKAKNPAITTKHPAVTAKYPAVMAKDPRVMAKDPRVTAKDPPVTAKDPPVTAKDPPVMAKDPPVTAKDPRVTAKDPPVTAKYPVVTAKDPLPVVKGNEDPPPLKRNEVSLGKVPSQSVNRDEAVKANEDPSPSVKSNHVPVKATDPPPGKRNEVPPVKGMKDPSPSLKSNNLPVNTKDPPVTRNEMPLEKGNDSPAITSHVVPPPPLVNRSKVPPLGERSGVPPSTAPQAEGWMTNPNLRGIREEPLLPRKRPLQTDDDKSAEKTLPSWQESPDTPRCHRYKESAGEASSLEARSPQHFPYDHQGREYQPPPVEENLRTSSPPNVPCHGAEWAEMAPAEELQFRSNKDFLIYLNNFEIENDEDVEYISKVIQNCIHAMNRFAQADAGRHSRASDTFR